MCCVVLPPLFCCEISGRTPLHHAVFANNKDIVRLLIDNKASVETRDVHGGTPIHYALQQGHENCVVSFAFCVNCTKGGVVKHAICRATHKHDGGAADSLFVFGCVVQEILAQANAGTDVLDLAGRTPLVWGIIHNQYASCKTLITAGAMVNVTDIQKFTPLHYAANAGRIRICQ